jgi:hypothetical protein
MEAMTMRDVVAGWVEALRERLRVRYEARRGAHTWQWRAGNLSGEVVLDPKRWCDWGLTLRLNGGCDDDATVFVGVPFVRCFVGLERFPAADRAVQWLGFRRWHSVEWGARLYRIDGETVARWAWAHNNSDSEYTYGKPWRHAYVTLENVVFGPVRIETTELERGATAVPMPEGVYPATYDTTRITHRRPRWPGVWAEWVSTFVEYRQGIDDGTHKGPSYGMSRTGRVYDTVGVIVGDLLKRRGHARPRVERVARRIVPLTQGAPGEFAWEERDQFTGAWSVVRHHIRDEPDMMSAAHVRARGYEIRESGCGCCRAEYGEACRDAGCANMRLRPENARASTEGA